MGYDYFLNYFLKAILPKNLIANFSLSRLKLQNRNIHVSAKSRA